MSLFIIQCIPPRLAGGGTMALPGSPGAGPPPGNGAAGIFPCWKAAAKNVQKKWLCDYLYLA